jgi:hypothetical protein
MPSDLELRGRLNVAKYFDAIYQNGAKHLLEVPPFLDVAFQIYNFEKD